MNLILYLILSAKRKSRLIRYDKSQDGLKEKGHKCINTEHESVALLFKTFGYFRAV